MLETIAQHVAALPLALQLIGLAAVLAIADFVFAVVAHLKAGDFHGTLLGEWVTSKGLPLVAIALLYGLDAAVHIVNVDVGGTDLGIFGALAYAQVISFIAQEAFSVIRNAKVFTGPPADETVADERTGA